MRGRFSSPERKVPSPVQFLDHRRRRRGAVGAVQPAVAQLARFVEYAAQRILLVGLVVTRQQRLHILPTTGGGAILQRMLVRSVGLFRRNGCHKLRGNSSGVAPGSR
jgi:hypothetical protein